MGHAERLARDGVCAPDCNSFKTRMGVKGPKDVTDVVPHGFDAEVEVMRDLFGRAAVLEQAQHLALSWCQVRMRRRRCIVLDIQYLPENTDHVAAALQRDSAEFDRDSLAVSADHDALVVGARRRPPQVT